MALIDNENLLPGVLTEVQAEYSLGFDDSQFGTTDGAIVIGTAFSGPVGKLVPISNVEQAQYVFGNAYNSETKKEASLTANLKAAFEAGCRTLYGIRISGKDLSKEFKFKIDNNMRLRVTSKFPNNEMKDCFFQYDNTLGAETLRLFKPASKATYVEKMSGLVESDSAVMITEFKLNQDYGFTRDARLVDVIELFNDHSYNNVLKLSIVDEAGVEVTNSPEAYKVALGVLFPGTYFIGRDHTAVACPAVTEVAVQLATVAKPYTAFDGLYSFKLSINTDVYQPYPIFADFDNIADFRTYLKAADVTTKDAQAIDYLQIQGVPDRVFVKDSVDYEETDLSSFDVYKRLGSGFAICAKAEKRTGVGGSEVRPRIKEAGSDDANRITALIDGIYSVIENAKIRYRVLACGNADDVINAKLPKAEDFLVTAPQSVAILGGHIQATAKVAEDNKCDAKAYSFKFEALTDALTSDQADIYTDKVMKVVPSVASEAALVGKAIEPGELVMVLSEAGTGALKRANLEGGFDALEGAGLAGKAFIVGNNIFVGAMVEGKAVFSKAAVTAAVTAVGETPAVPAKYLGKEYVLGENNDNVYAYQVVDLPAGQLAPVGDFNTMIKGDDDKTLVFVTNNSLETNAVLVKSVLFEGTGITLEELVAHLNEHECLSRLFSFAVAPESTEVKDDFIADILTNGLGAEVVMAADRKAGYDYNKYIPYKTNDNFARQLAQHVTYTDLKTGPAHGVIGLARTMDTSLGNIAKRVDAFVSTGFDLYAKTNSGRNMLDKNNLPYSIGKAISITAFQSKVAVDGYTYVANGAASYVGMVSDLAIDQSSTGQAINVTPMYEYTTYQLGRLTTKGFITLHDTLTNGYVITDGTTMDEPSSPFKRFSSVRIMAAVEELIRSACEPFIGKQNNSTNRNSMQTAIKSNLDKIKDTLILSYTFSVIYNKELAKLNIVDVDYDIVPTHEIRNIRNRVTVKE